MTLPETDILGLRIHAVDLAAALAWAEQSIRQARPAYVCHVNVHTLVESWRDAALHAALSSATLAAPDGMPLVWQARRQGQPGTGRVYGPDFMTALLASTAQWTDRPCRHFFYGSTPAVMQGLLAAIRERHPATVIAGALTPPFRPLTAEEMAQHRAAIDASEADVVWIGLGAPRQEIWMHANRPLLRAPLLVGVGAAFDFIAGNKRQAPLWMQRAGLEWCFRMATEPARLGPRYASTIPPFLWRLLRAEFAAWGARR
ncbi:WecB/TagA/CpsF family glycosyltransferase [Ferrovibrio sp.]|uniref:WecB/TagA/CpsF family glycosyltransferase n=1 Tax=Ferrovibrio sp. TaxID=1917215 RepID=UPI003D0F0B5D